MCTIKNRGTINKSIAQQSHRIIHRRRECRHRGCKQFHLQVVPLVYGINTWLYGIVQRTRSQEHVSLQ